MSVNLAIPLRSAIIANVAISSKLAQFRNEPGVFTRRPVPDDAKYMLIAISPDIANYDEDGLKTFRTRTTKDIFIYGEQPDDYRDVENIGYLLREMFHRKKDSIVVPGHHIISVTALGPMIAPTEEMASNQPNIVGRLVSLTIFSQPAN